MANFALLDLPWDTFKKRYDMLSEFKSLRTHQDVCYCEECQRWWDIFFLCPTYNLTPIIELPEKAESSK